MQDNRRNICASLIGCICKTSLTPASPTGCATKHPQQTISLFTLATTVQSTAMQNTRPENAAADAE